MSIRRVPVSPPGADQNPKFGGFAVVGVLFPLSMQGPAAELQNPCSVADAGVAAASAAPASAIFNTRRILDTLPLPLEVGLPARPSVDKAPIYATQCRITAFD